MSLLSKLGFGIAGAVIWEAASSIAKGVTASQKTPKDLRIQELISKSGLFFDVPVTRPWNNSGSVWFGREPAPQSFEPRLPKAQVSVSWENSVPRVQIEGLDHSQLLGFNQQIKNEVVDYCVETLNKIHRQTLLSEVLGLKIASREIMVRTALNRSDGTPLIEPSSDV